MDYVYKILLQMKLSDLDRDVLMHVEAIDNHIEHP